MYSPLLPTRTGLSFKPQHFQAIQAQLPALGFFEVHPENYMSPGGKHLHMLENLAEHYALSMHGVGLSLGSSGGLNVDHVQNLKRVVERFQPAQVSEHLSWSHWNAHYMNDLLPLPLTGESLQCMLDNIDTLQNTLKRNILIENPSAYLDFSISSYSEAGFLNELCRRSGCGLLLDLNNIVVSSHNNHFSSSDYLKEINSDFIGEIHLAGHSETTLANSKKIKLDDHGSSVSDTVWALYASLLETTQRPFPTLIEWDCELPEFSTLYAEAEKAAFYLERVSARELVQC